ncbi:MAG: hypothetical protein V9E87_10385 [Gemmatimonadales bacterium]
MSLSASPGGTFRVRADVLHRSARLHRPEGDDLPDRVAPVLRSRTYSITSPRRSSQKSTSMSGIETRSGFRKRSKSEVEAERVDVGDPEAVGDDANRPPSRGPARPGSRGRAPR